MEDLKKHSAIITFVGQILIIATFYFNLKSEVEVQKKEIEQLRIFTTESRTDREVIHKTMEIEGKNLLIELTKIQKDIQFIKEKITHEPNY